MFMEADDEALVTLVTLLIIFGTDIGPLCWLVLCSLLLFVVVLRLVLVVFGLGILYSSFKKLGFEK